MRHNNSCASGCVLAGLLGDFQVLVGSSIPATLADTSGSLCAFHTGTAAASTSETLTCSGDVSGQYVVVVVSLAAMHLCDLEIRGTPGECIAACRLTSKLVSTSMVLLMTSAH